MRKQVSSYGSAEEEEAKPYHPKQVETLALLVSSAYVAVSLHAVSYTAQRAQGCLALAEKLLVGVEAEMDERVVNVEYAYLPPLQFYAEEASS